MRHRAPRPVLDRLRPLARTGGALATAALVLGGVALGAMLSAGDPADDAPAAGPTRPAEPLDPEPARRDAEPASLPTRHPSVAPERDPQRAERSTPSSPRGASRTQPVESSDDGSGDGLAKGRMKATGGTPDDRPTPGSRGRSDKPGTKRHPKK